ncbi:MAG TPA: hypothetical protein VK139_03750 [Microbacteriaceae bacterium]|nr:hypothetical protein [Microbacteriaceae bacterium]
MPRGLRIVSMLALSLTLVATGVPAFATGSYLWSELRQPVDTQTWGQPVAVSNGGTTVLGWIDRPTRQAHAMFSNDGGVTWGNALTMSDPGSNTHNLAVSAFGENGFAFAWGDYVVDDVVVRITNANGSSWSAPQALGAGNAFDIALTPIGIDRVGAVARSLDGGNEAVVAVSDPGGTFGRPSTRFDTGGPLSMQYADNVVSVFMLEGGYSHALRGYYSADFGVNWLTTNQLVANGIFNSMEVIPCGDFVVFGGQISESPERFFALGRDFASSTWEAVHPASEVQLGDAHSACLSNGDVLSVWNEEASVQTKFALSRHTDAGWVILEEGILPINFLGGLRILARPDGGAILISTWENDSQPNVYAMTWNPSVGWSDRELIGETGGMLNSIVLTNTPFGAFLALNPWWDSDGSRNPFVATFQAVANETSVPAMSQTLASTGVDVDAHRAQILWAAGLLACGAVAVTLRSRGRTSQRTRRGD